MKNKLNKMLLIISISMIILISLLFILGSFKRVGYLNDFKLISYKKGVYSYNFRISYYSKIFRNSDIYGVYIDIDNTIKENNYIKKIIINKKGSPFGVLESNKKIEKNIDGIVYTLRLKNIVFVLLVIFIVILLIYPLLSDLINILLKINFKNRYAYIVIIFLSFLIMPNIIYFLFRSHFDNTNYENRLKADKPVLSITNLVNYSVEYEKYFNDHIAFRNELVKLKNYMDVLIFNNFISSDFLFAKDKWVFSKRIFLMNRNFFSIEELKQGAYNLLHFRDELKKRNIDFIFMVCPYSANIMVNMYPKYIKPIEYNSTDQFISYISKNTDLKIVYPKKQLLEYKDKYQLYYKYDHHWNNIGAYVGFKVLSDKLSMNLDKLSDLNVLSFDISYRKYWVFNNNYDFYNTSVRTMNLHNLKYFRDDPIYYIEKYHIKTNYYFLEGHKHYHSPSITRSAVASNDYNVFFIDDSYAYGMFDYIATEFYKASFRHRVEFKAEEIIKYQPNIVVFELVEGNLKNVVLDIIPSYQIEEINKDL